MLIESLLARSRFNDERLVRGDDGRLENPLDLIADGVGDVRPVRPGLLRRDRVEFIVTFFQTEKILVCSLCHYCMSLCWCLYSLRANPP